MLIMKCEICGKLCNSINGLVVHIRCIHKEITIQQYYLQYISIDSNICKCGKHTKWISFSKGFRKYCNTTCSINYRDENKKQCTLKLNNIIKYGVENVFQLDTVKRKIQDTNNTIYGTNYATQSQKIKDKIKKTNIERYGEAFATKNDTIKDKLKTTNMSRYGGPSPTSSNVIRDKIQLKNIERYNNKYYTSSTIYKQQFHNFYLMSLKNNNIELLDEYTLNEDRYNLRCYICGTNFNRVLNKSIIKTITCPSCNRATAIENKIKQILDSYNINYSINNRSIISPYELDFYLPEYNIAIECNGLYWHSEQVLRYNNKYTTYHLTKHDLCKDKGIQLLQFFEDEIHNNYEQITGIILSKCKLLKRLCTARECKLSIVSNDIASTFLNSNHIQGATVGKLISIGAYYNNILIAIMTFNIVQYNMVELCRFCTLNNYYITGISSRLLKFFIKYHKYETIVSFADKRISNGNLYDIIGFTRVNDTPPSYFYLYNDTRLHRRGFQHKYLKDKLDIYDNELTEYQNMLNNGYDRIWDCGKIKYEYINS